MIDVDALVDEICRRTGLAPRPELVATVARHAAGGARVDAIEALIAEVAVGETYFFRHAEQFAFLEETALPALARAGRDEIGVWSAGCASGEEAWSLAASCRHAFAGRAQILGTDVVPARVAAATRAVYGRWSVRGTPRLPVVDARGDEFVVKDALRPLVRFAVHDLREPPPGLFDVIFCRNVLLFLSEETQARVLDNLRRALSPEGILVFGPVDVGAAALDLVPAAPPELNVYRPARPPQRAATFTPAAVAAPPAPVERNVALHVAALEAVEAGRFDEAERLLSRCGRDYLPGSVERALLLDRSGARARARAEMGAALRALLALPDDDNLVGPEPLPVRYWRTTAEEFLKRRGSS